MPRPEPAAAEPEFRPAEPAAGLASAREVLSLPAVLAIVLLTLLVLAGWTTLWDRDEPRFARAAVEMLGRGDFLVPHFNGELRLHKPAGVYWLMAAGVKVLGVTELAVRWPSIAGMLASCLLTFDAGRRLFDARVGTLAALILGTSGMSLWIGTAATADGTLLACMTAAMWVSVHRITGRLRGWHVLAMTAALGFGLLVKGPVALLPVLGIACYGVIGRKHTRLYSLDLIAMLAAVIFAVGLFAAWGVPANIATGGKFVSEGLGEHVLDRAVSARESHGAGGLTQGVVGLLKYVALLPAYLPILLIAMLPWTLLLPATFSAARRGLFTGRNRAVLLCWTLPTFIVMSLVATKLPHYIMPTLPGFAVAMAAVFYAWRDGRLDEKSLRWLRRGEFFVTPVIIGGAIACIVGGYLLGGTSGAIRGTLAAVVLIGLMILAVLRHQKKDYTSVLWWCGIGVPISVMAVVWLVMPTVERALKPSPGLAGAIRLISVPFNQVAATGDADEPSLIFYLNRRADQPVITGESLSDLLRAPGSRVIYTSTDELAEAGLTEDQVFIPYRRSVINYSSRGQEKTILMLLKQ